jgi:ATP-dependent HslUV protease ATP-binding subunit HslU
VLEGLSFDAPDRAEKHVVVDGVLVRQRLDELTKDEELSRFIL